MHTFGRREAKRCDRAQRSVCGAARNAERPSSKAVFSAGKGQGVGLAWFGAPGPFPALHSGGKLSMRVEVTSRFNLGFRTPLGPTFSVKGWIERVDEYHGVLYWEVPSALVPWWRSAGPDLCFHIELYDWMVGSHCCSVVAIENGSSVYQQQYCDTEHLEVHHGEVEEFCEGDH